MTATASIPKRVTLDKVASSTLLANVKSRVDLGFDIPARAGTVVAGRILNAKSKYNTLEDMHGRMRLLLPGDIIAGALGHRNALHGYVGHVPEVVKPGDVLNVLNLGGVIGKCTGFNPDVGPPFEMEVMGAVLNYPTFGARQPVATVIEQSALLAEPSLPEKLPPVVIVLGTSMNAGKTTAVCQILRHLKRKEMSVAAAKCTGVSLQRDVLEMRDFGAAHTMSFMDLGVITTSPGDAPGVTRAIIRRLAEEEPQLILLELGDGILGTYGVAQILDDPAVYKAITTTVLCATDPVSAWGGMHILTTRYKLHPCVVSGPVTDNQGGALAVRTDFGVPAFNARMEADQFVDTILAAVAARGA